MDFCGKCGNRIRFNPKTKAFACIACGLPREAMQTSRYQLPVDNPESVVTVVNEASTEQQATAGRTCPKCGSEVTQIYDKTMRGDEDTLVLFYCYKCKISTREGYAY